jgi:outer membrane protein assembly factor BamB
MESEIISALMLTLLLTSAMTLAFSIKPVKASGTIYIRADDSIDPPTASIQQDGDVFATDSIDWWPMAGHDSMHSGYSTSKAPISNRIDWNITLPDYSGFNGLDGIALAVSDDMVFATTYGSSGPAMPPGIIYVLNATKGQAIWNFTADGDMSWIAGFSQPAVGNGIVVVPSYERYIYGLNETSGANLWTYYLYGSFFWWRPVIVDGMVLVGEVGGGVAGLYAINQTTGQEIWKYTSGGSVYGPAVADGMVFAACGDKEIRALNQTSGEEIWKFDAGDVGGEVSVKNGIVFAGTTGRFRSPLIFALNQTSGQHIWNYTVDAKANDITVAYGKIFVGVGDYNKVAAIYALDETTGSLYWVKTGIQGMYSSICVADYRILWDLGQNGLMCLDQSTGNTAWSVQGEWADVVIANNAAYALQVLRVGTTRQASVIRFADAHDVATTNVNPDKTTIVKDVGSQEVIIEVTVENQGSFTEDFNVTAYASTTQVDKKTVTNLNLGASKVLSFTWDTTGFDIGNYTISAVADTVTNETDTLDNTCIDGTVKIRLPIHDIAITDVTSSKTIVGQGYDTNINATVANQGDYTETFNVTVYANTTIIANLTDITHSSGNSTTEVFPWNTTGFAYDNYTIWAYAWPVSDEAETDDNNCTCGFPVHVGVPGDVSSSTPGVYDKVTNMFDIAYLISLYQTKPNKPPWYPNADVDNNGVVDMMDIAIAIYYFNQRE